jgi:hypothetical protein
MRIFRENGEIDMTRALTVLTGTAFASLVSLSTLMASEGGAAVTTCSGGAQEFINGITNNTPVANGGGPVPMPFTTLAGGPSGGAGDADLYVVTWSGQSVNTVGAWQIQAQVSVNGGAFFPIDPIGPNIMHTGATQETNTMTWCRRLAAANSTTFRIQWNKIGGGVVTVDNYLTKVERSN